MDCQLLMHGSVYVHIATFVKAAYIGKFVQVFFFTILILGSPFLILFYHQVQALVDAMSIAEQMQLLELLKQRLL